MERYLVDSPSMASRTPRITTQTLAILSMMLSDPIAEWYGLDLSDRVRLEPGTIYPILRRLLEVGWLTRRWEDIDPSEEGRPRRRLYRLTGVGERAAREAIEEHLAMLARAANQSRWQRRARPGPQTI